MLFTDNVITAIHLIREYGMLFINNNGSTHLSNCIQKTFGFFPSKTWIGNRFSVNMITSDLLISRFNITLDHKPFYQSMKFRVYLAAVENLFCNTNLLVILFIRIRVVGINNNSRIFKVFLLIFLPEKTKILVMIVRDCLPMFIYGTAENCMSQFITCYFYLPPGRSGRGWIWHSSKRRFLRESV